MDLVLWTNNACSKSRSAERLLTEHNIPFTKRYYLDDPPTQAEIEAVMAMLDDPTSITRQPDADSKTLSEDPSLIQRPIAIRGDRAVVARPPERALELYRDAEGEGEGEGEADVALANCATIPRNRS